ncbi:phage portal protein [Paenibacillus sp. YN15]|uniref:phage portal protein n=1 Tax=Paenibacillus sp. YN15 TaxID=1742774 RepID=UPI00215CC653|nr:phage portal protein [Paenibacillus sp. YN15]
MTRLFYPGAHYPPDNAIPRLARYKRGRTIFDGRHPEIYERASSLLKDTPHAAQLKTLFIAVNLMDILLTKPADLLTGEPPTYEAGTGPDSIEQKRLDSIVEENDLTQMMHELVIGGGYRGDSWIKTYYAARADMSETEALGLEAPATKLEPIIEAVPANVVFPELARGSRKKFKAVNIAWIDWVEEPSGRVMRWLSGTNETYTPYLVVERHIPGYITYERFRLTERGVNAEWGVPIATYTVGEKVATGREEDIVATGTDRLLVHHIPYKSVDDRWEGINGVEKLESVLSAINERLAQIDYILWKHSDPTAYGPDIDGEADDGASVRFGGRYIPVAKDEATPGYMVWEGQLNAAFTELDVLLGIVYQMSETPQWLFGTTLASDKGGTGTSHTDSGAIKARFMPILAKVNRIRAHVDRALRDAIWTAMQLENYANQGVEGWVPYNPVYPRINWRDGVPIDEKEAAEVAHIRTGGKATISVLDAIKTLDGVDDATAIEMVSRIDDDETRVMGTVDGTVFNSPSGADA